MNGLSRVASVTTGLWLVGCNPQLGDMAQRTRLYDPGIQYPSQIEKPRPGSVWTPSARGVSLLQDNRARQLGDTVVVVIQENSQASGGANTDLSRDSSTSLSITDIGAVLKYLQPALMGAELAGGKTNSDFTGAGTTARSGKLTARISATVKKVMPNGYLFVEGQTSYLVNRELQILYVSGIIRPTDVSNDNSIESSRLADAEISFNGVGVISDKQGPGFLQRGLDVVNPL